MRYPIFSIFLLVALLLSATSSYGQVSGQTGSNSFLTGQLLIAKDSMRDPRFAKTVILMIQHDQHGAMGLVVNKPVGEGPLAKLMEGFGIQSEGAEGTVRLYYGGPVDRRIGFVIHSPEYRRPGTRTINSVASITTHPKVFRDIADEKGPKKKIFTMGYTGWGAGQLERELARDNWLVAPAKEALIFSQDVSSVWDWARVKAGLPL